MTAAACPLCASPGGRVVVQAPSWRVVHVDEVGLPAFYRVVWQAHVREFTDLAPHEREECIAAVVQVEQALRLHLPDAKINLASLGNMVAHLHWHVVARFPWDSTFPASPWSPAARIAAPEESARIARALPGIEDEIRRPLVSPAAKRTPS